MSYITLVVRRKHIASDIALVPLSIAAAVAALEALVRIAGIAPPLPAQYTDNVRDEAIVFKRRPGSVITRRSESGEFPFRYEHNSLGFRDTEHALVKPAGSVRIVALGDSFTYGVGADFGDTYPAQVERRLNARAGAHARVEIINLGLPRHFPALERLTLQRYGLRFAPDVVLVAVLPNDIIDTQRGLDAVCLTETGYFVPCAAVDWADAAVWIYQHSAVGRVVLRAWSGHANGDAAPNDSLFRDNGPYESAWRAVERDLERMQEVARRDGAVLVVAALPQKPPWREVHAYPEARLGRWSTAHGAVFIPTLAALQAADPSRSLYWERDGHCTPAGYAVIAEAIATALVAHALAP